MNRFILLSLILVLVYISTEAAGGNIGVTSQCINQNCFVNASSSLVSIICGLILLVFVFKFPRTFSKTSEVRAGVWRRFGAFFVDFLVVINALTPFMVIPALSAEFGYTGEFNWRFERDFARPTDNLIILPTVFLMIGILLYYFYYFGIRYGQTVGQYILGYKVISTNEPLTKQTMKKRVLYSAIGMCAWPITIVHALNNEKRFWWDSKTDTESFKNAE